MVGSAALELATSFDVGYKNACILHLLDTSWNRKNLGHFLIVERKERQCHKLFMTHQ